MAKSTSAKPKEQKEPKPAQITLFNNTATRAFIRSHNDTIINTDGLYKVHLDIIRVNPGFQPRQKPDGMLEELWEQILGIPALADAIWENGGPIDPLLGDIYAVDGTFILTEGECRTRAMRHLIRTGREFYPDGKTPVNIVKVLLNPPGITDKDRMRIAISSGNKLPFTVMQRARYYQKFVSDHGMTHEQVAEFLGGLSRQTVDNYILCLSLPEDVQSKLDTGEIAITAALAEYRASKKPAGNQVLVDADSGEVIERGQDVVMDLCKDTEYKKKQEEEKEKLSGDEDEFAQKDNSISGVSSKGGAKEEGSGAHVIGKDAIYMDGIKLALWKQFVNRYEKVKTDIMDGNRLFISWEDELAARLKDEYNLTVK